MNSASGGYSCVRKNDLLPVFRAFYFIKLREESANISL